jgi:3-oxoacyl-[acyl-carrier protein] reductase
MKILITGVSRGLGFKIAETCLKKNWEVFGISRTQNDKIKNLISAYGNKFQWLEVDLSSPGSVKQSIYDNILKVESVDGFVNNAAKAYDDLITNVNHEKLAMMYQINVLSPILLTKLVIRNMLLNRKKGSIVHISSVSAHTGYKGLAMYASTKGALEAFSKNTAREWGSIGIRSNCIVAGFMETSMSGNLSKEQKVRIYRRTSKKEAVSISSVAQSTCFLLSEKSNSITGQNLFVDNGTI